MPHLGPPSVSPKISQGPARSCTSLCRSHYEENWNLRLKGVGGGALSLLQSVSGPPHGALPPQITPIFSLLAVAAASLSLSHPASVSLSVSTALLV